MEMAMAKTPAAGAASAKRRTNAAASPLGAVERACRFIEARVDEGERFT